MEIILLCSAEVGNATDTNKVQVRCTVDASTVGECTFTGTGTGEYKSFSGYKKINLSAATHTVDIDYRALAGTAEIMNAHVILHRVN